MYYAYLALKRAPYSESMKKRILFQVPDGRILATPSYTDEDRIAWFRTQFAKANPPPKPGTFPVKYNQVVSKEPNRWLCVGGPMDENEGIAKVLKMKKGRGKNSIEVMVPINPDSFTVEANGIVYTYKFDGEKYETK